MAHKSPQQGPKMLRAFYVGLLPFDYSLMVTVVKPPAKPNYDERVNERDEVVQQVHGYHPLSITTRGRTTFLFYHETVYPL
ncbi:hypothetical protein ACEE97_10785 (plasmid) [Limosilactobacillus reuteri]